MTDETQNPRIEHLLEAALYVDDLDRAEAFYRDMLGMELLGKEAGAACLLSGRPSASCCSSIPRQRGKKAHSPFTGPKERDTPPSRISADSLDSWRTRLQGQGIAIETEITWPRGGRSLYFRDPAGNLVELVTPGVWGLPSGW